MSKLPAPTNSPTTESLTPTPTTPAQVGRGIAVAALLIALGNLASRVLGQARESIIAYLFGTTVESSAYAIASAVPTSLYDFIVGGLVSAALVPVFSELADRDEGELGQVAGTIFTAATLVMGLAAGLAWLAAQPLGTLLTAQGGPSALRSETISLIRWMVPAAVLMALAGLITGLLQARRQFLLPAFSTATFNLGIIAGGLLFTGIAGIGVQSLAIGMFLGALGQVVLQLPGLRGVRLRLGLDLRHPHVRRIGRLYIPVMIGISFSLIGVVIDRALASGVSSSAAATMRFATTLIQLALGIVATAISLAALPTLSRQGADANDLTEYRRTLALSIKALLLLLLPITALLAALATPIASLLFEWGRASAQDAQAIATALLVYLPMLVAAGIDQPLIFAFYARRNTLLPNLVNGGAIAAYLVVALLLVRPLGVYGLILGNVAQWWVHALLMLWFAHRRLDALRGQRLVEAACKGCVASGAAGLVCVGLLHTTRELTFSKWGNLLLIGGLGALTALVYLVAAHLLRIEALHLFGSALRRRIRR
ncbi:MAG: murein biosynthesis integral membrane protein MurJ [Chloroflexota bacterium]|nr:murein biosynthesis integral membrane protein MurJ [Chloroflexota bacterium]PLS77114.1 MAG: murein biosynthesis integral membrane protein MurJ [Chloroflexota bacterium]